MSPTVYANQMPACPRARALHERQTQYARQLPELEQLVSRLQKRWEAGLDVGQALRAAQVDANACRYAIRHGLDDAADMLIGRSAAR